MFIVLGKFAREAAATLLKYAKSTSDPEIAAKLVEKAADINERIGDSSRRERAEAADARRRTRDGAR